MYKYTYIFIYINNLSEVWEVRSLEKSQIQVFCEAEDDEFQCCCSQPLPLCLSLLPPLFPFPHQIIFRSGWLKNKQWTIK